MSSLRKEISQNTSVTDNTRNTRPRKQRKKRQSYPPFIEQFALYLEKRGYSPAGLYIRKKRVVMFLRDIDDISNVSVTCLDDCKQIDKNVIQNYEDYLTNRCLSREITDITVYGYIKNLKVFLDYLYALEIITFEYKIPKKFIVNPKRANEYVHSSTIVSLIENMFSNKSEINFRNISILRIILETGCRPIEISSIKIDDLNVSERTIIVQSFKSGQRKLELSNELMFYLKKYLETRNTIVSESSSLFLTNKKDGITSSFITSLIYSENIKAFGKAKVNARALRHTFTTNAIENRNDLKEISNSLGHKHLSSTMHYLHRSKERLLSNTLSYDPIKTIFKEETNGNKNN